MWTHILRSLRRMWSSRCARGVGGDQRVLEESSSPRRKSFSPTEQVAPACTPLFSRNLNAPRTRNRTMILLTRSPFGVVGNCSRPAVGGAKCQEQAAARTPASESLLTLHGLSVDDKRLGVGRVALFFTFRRPAGVIGSLARSI
ncbi:hypothetical protein EYF80_039478 [Liparis tanakae]|uniref:Uncharacterized protein n=1 Tax=Liparis tanakae TaxID=230148 RepID=A0A4Z2GCG5_9TELE|nr:hypothetical protein EYF80_039478 [Liparis tanakae]